MLKLSKTQEKLVKQKNRGSAVIKGEALSGKTEVAIGRMLHLAECQEDGADSILFVTRTLEGKAYVEACYQRFLACQNISLFEEAGKGEVRIETIDALIEEAADKAHVHFNLQVVEEIPDDLVSELLPLVKKAYPKVKWLTKGYLDWMKEEITWIQSAGISSLEAYQGAMRKGAKMKLPKLGSGRKAMWQLSTQINSALKEQGKILKSEVQLEALQYLREDKLRKCYRHIIIDDAVYYTKVQLEFVHHLKAEEVGDLLFLIESKPTPSMNAWLASGYNFKSIGYDMTGKVKTLRKKKAKVPKVPIARVSALTPLEEWMMEVDASKKQPVAIKKPWYMETYCYMNKLTGVEMTFERDSSAGELYIGDEKQAEKVVLPLYSDIAAGLPIEVVEEAGEGFELPSALLRQKKHTYMLHVQGDSMIGAGIEDGDYVVIQAGNVQNNEIAAVYYNGATTLKRIVQEGDQVYLCSENSKYDPIVIEEGEFRVMGKLVGVIRPMEASS